MNKVGTVREVSLSILEKIEKQQAYSHLLIHDAMTKNHVKPIDKGLLTELVYGTIQRQMTLDFYIEQFVSKPEKLEIWVKLLLRVSFYQLYFLDKVPDHAIVNEAVNIAKKRGHVGVSKLVNGVLRTAIREGQPDVAALVKEPMKRLSIEISVPLWLTERWVAQYGEAKTREIGEALLVPPHQTLRVNPLRGNIDEIIEALVADGFEAEAHPLVPEAIMVFGGNAANHPMFQYGAFSIQDESSMLVAHALHPEPGMRVLDACAAPGGKTTHIAELMNDEGQIDALDIHAHKTKLIAQGAKRLGHTIIKPFQADARQYGKDIEEELYDRILVDAPCSGFGVIRRKPDIKYQKTAKDVASLSVIQFDILDALAPLLKVGGRLVYSTCTIDEDENRNVWERFLEAHPNYEKAPLSLPNDLTTLDQTDLQLLPDNNFSDGFYISSFKRIR